MEVLTSSAVECDLISKQDLYRDNEVKMRSLGWARAYYDWCPYIEGAIHTETHMGKQHVNMKAEIGVRHLETKEHERWPASHEKLPRSLEAWNTVSLRALLMNQPCRHRALRLSASRTPGQSVSVILAPPVGGSTMLEPRQEAQTPRSREPS